LLTRAPGQPLRDCSCQLSELNSSNLETTRLRYLAEIEVYQRSIRDSKSSSQIKGLADAIQRGFNGLVHIVQHQEQFSEGERIAKEGPLPIIARGTISTIYEAPESFGRLVIKIGPLKNTLRERLNILRVEKAFKKFGPSIGSRSPSSRLSTLHAPKHLNHIPTGFEQDGETDLLKPCAGVNPRVPVCRDNNGNRMPADSDNQVGIVLRRIENLNQYCCEKLSQKVSNLIGPSLDEALVTNGYCFIRIHLGTSSDEVSGDRRGDERSSNVNLPGWLGFVSEACKYKECGDDLAKLAGHMGNSYAKLHWGAELDGGGIEFHLGSSWTGHDARLHVLDFDKCLPTRELSAHCVREQLVPAALQNDPYIPRPVPGGSNEKDDWLKDCVWNAFKEYYLDTSVKILTTRGFEPEYNLPEHNLPKIFIDGLERHFLPENTQMTPVPSFFPEYAAPNDGGFCGSGDLEDAEDDGDVLDGQIQVDNAVPEHGHTRNDGYDSDNSGDDDSSEDAGDNDYEFDDMDWRRHNLFWFGVPELTFTPLPPLKPILKKPATGNTTSATQQNPPGVSTKRRVTFFHSLPSYRLEKGPDAPFWKQKRSRSPILLGFH
jgi:hypothetical protein